MPGATVHGAVDTGLVGPFVGTSVWVKDAWDQDWTWMPYVRAIEAEENANPTVSNAQFSHWYGRVKREDFPEFEIWSPVTLLGRYVMILAHDGFGTWPVWCGVMEDETGRTMNTIDWAQGEQRFSAYGLEHLMDRVHVIGAKTGRGWIQRDLAFNKRDRTGASVLGNRSSEPDENGCYTFSSDGETWTNLDVIRYLIVNYLNAGPGTHPLYLVDGCVAALDGIEDVWNLGGSSVFEALNQLIDRRRGLGWRVITWPQPGAPVVIYVYSLLDFGTELIPANQDMAIIDMDGVNDATMTVTFDNRPRYHQMIVRGGPVSVCGSFAMADGTLEAGWTAQEEEDYKSATDDGRKSHAFDDVYQRLVVPDDWDGSLGDGEGGTLNNALPSMLGAPEPDWMTPSLLFQENRRFAPVIPYYEKDPAVDGRQPDFRQFAVFVWLDENVEHANGAWDYIDKVDWDNLSPCHAQVSDADLALRLVGRMNHVLAKGDFTAGSAVEAQYSYRDLILTAMLETDQRMHVVVLLAAPGLGESIRTKIVEVPDALIWAIMPGTVYDVVEGALQKEESLRYARNDADQLVRIADYAIAAFGRPRASIALQIANVLPVHPVGSLIAGAIGQTTCNVGSVVSSQAWNFRECSMAIRTSYEEIDLKLQGRVTAPRRRPQTPWKPGMPVTVDWWGENGGITWAEESGALDWTGERIAASSVPVTPVPI